MRFTLLPFALILWCLTSVHGQLDSSNSVFQKFSIYRNQTLTEKIYVHIDRSFFLTGESIWFKVYYVDGEQHQPSDVSKVVYVELVDASGNSSVQTKIGVNREGGEGTLALPTTLRSGNYIFRAYTNWMKNFDSDYFFTEKVTIVNPFVPLERVQISDSTTYDVQFFPEGGYLINDLVSKVAFRAIDSNGAGIHITGVVISEQDTVAKITSQKFGLGSFYMKPVKGRKYEAIVRYQNNTMAQFDLPIALDYGYSMEVKNTSDTRISIDVKSNFPFSQEPVLLFVHTRNKVGFATTKSLKNGVAHFDIDQGSLPEGVSHFTVFNQILKPVCERLYFKKVESIFDLSANFSKTHYTTRDEISLLISSDSLRKRSLRANLSMAVYRLDSLTSYKHESITDYLKLTSDLTRGVENASYYIQKSATLEEIDNLMLTHGWRRFKWNDILNGSVSKIFRYLPEINGHLVKGVLKYKETGKPAANINIYLSIPAISQFSVSSTNENGEFFFEVKHHGVERIILQTAEGGFQLDLTDSFSQMTSLAKGLEKLKLVPKNEEELKIRSIHMQVQNAFGHEQQTASVARQTKSPVFFGKPDVTYRLDEYTRFPSMEEVLREYVPEVAVRRTKNEYDLFITNPIDNSFFVNKPLVLLDGTPIFHIDKLLDVDVLQIETLDIIEQNYNFSKLSFGGILSYSTYKGNLADYSLDSLAKGIAYESLNATREFAMPKYDIPENRSSPIADARNLLFWNPTSITDDHGNINVKFFSSDISGRYMLIVNGITDSGLTGYGTFVFDVKKE